MDEFINLWPIAMIAAMLIIDAYTGKKEKVMRLLISKYRIRITSKIAELQDNIELLKSLL